MSNLWTFCAATLMKTTIILSDGTPNSCNVFKLWINWFLFWHYCMVINLVCCTFSLTDSLRKLFRHFEGFTLLYVQFYHLEKKKNNKGKSQAHKSLSKINKSRSNKWFWTFIHTNMILFSKEKKVVSFIGILAWKLQHHGQY